MIDISIIIIYLLVILGVGYLGFLKAKTRDDYSVVSRKLGTLMFTSTMSATVLGGASTIGTIGLGYIYGISALWLAACLGFGLIGLSLFFIKPLIDLKLYTVTQVLELKYRFSVKIIGSIVMMVYDLMVAVTSVIAMAAILSSLFDISMNLAILLGGAIVILYAVMGGMWSLAHTDIMQFMLMTIGLMLVLMPISISKAGGFTNMQSVLPASYFSLTGIGKLKIFTYFLIYCLGIFIGQDIWQRVFTAKNKKVAQIGTMTAGIYCILWGIMGAIIGMSARVFLPEINNPDTAFISTVKNILPIGVKGLVIAAALSALMSTASACMMATSTIGVYDIYAKFFGQKKCTILVDRVATLLTGVFMLMIASMIGNVIAALTIAYNLLVGSLLIPLMGAIFWKKSSSVGAIIAITLSSITSIIFMIKDGLLANSSTYYALVVSFVAFILGSLFYQDAQLNKF